VVPSLRLHGLIVLFAVAVTGCSTMDKLMFWKGEEPPKVASEADPALSAENVKSSSIQELELKNARLWTRVDELEEKVTRQRERLKILERGLMLGILPDELKGSGEESSRTGSKNNSKAPLDPAGHVSDSSASSVLRDALASAESDAAAVKKNGPATAKGGSDGAAPVGAAGSVESSAAAASADSASASAAKLSPKEQEEYQRLLGSAHDHYRAGRYGKAVVEFSEIGKVFGDLVDGGMHRFWIARSWIGLKEFQTARQQLTEFLRDFPASPWAPRAKLELARTEFQLGLKEKSLQRLREIIQTHPYEDAAEMAKMELNNLQKAL